MNHLLIKKIEQISMNALPALKTEQVDGWTLRFANGYTKRANSIYPLEYEETNINETIKKCERIYFNKHLPIYFKMTEQSEPRHLDDVLAGLGYKFGNLTSVKEMELDELPNISENENIIVFNELNDRWFESVCQFNNIDKNNQSTFKQMLTKIEEKTCFVLLENNDRKIVSCGMGVLEDSFLGVYDIVTSYNHRGQGYGKKLMVGLLHWGKQHGAKVSYLQVEKTNIPAIKLYRQLGFKKAYTYWYRMKE